MEKQKKRVLFRDYIDSRNSRPLADLVRASCLEEHCIRCNGSRVRYSSFLLRDIARTLKGSNCRACLSCGHKWHIVDPDSYPGRRMKDYFVLRVGVIGVLSLAAGKIVAFLTTVVSPMFGG